MKRNKVKTTVKEEIVKSIVKAKLADKEKASQVLEDVLSIIKKTLATGEHVKIPKLGTFTVRSKVERLGRNPRNKEEKVISARRVVTLRQSAFFKKSVYEGNK